jgi:hypothetical protein
MSIAPGWRSVVRKRTPSTACVHTFSICSLLAQTEINCGCPAHRPAMSDNSHAAANKPAFKDGSIFTQPGALANSGSWCAHNSEDCETVLSPTCSRSMVWVLRRAGSDSRVQSLSARSAERSRCGRAPAYCAGGWFSRPKPSAG